MGSALSTRSLTNSVPKIYYAEKTATFKLNGKEDLTSLREFIYTKCPSLFQPFRPAWWLSGGHLQTLYAAVGDFSKVDKVVYDRKLIRLRDGGTLGLDFTPPANGRVIPDETPIVVVLHGLTGGSHESYVRAVLNPAVTPPEEGGLGYRAVVVNFRGCAGVPLTSPQLYSAGHTDDIRSALTYLADLYPKAPMLGVGFSLGANVLTRYLAQEGKESRLITGCALACPWDLVRNSEALMKGFLSRNIYSRGMASNLQTLVRRHLESIAEFPDSLLARNVPEALSIKNIRLKEFDSRITGVAGGSSPPFPFATADDYYVWASTHELLDDVRVPFLTMNADDDPIVVEVPVDSFTNSWVAMVVTRGGGHLGWFEQMGWSFEVKRWMSKPVIEWLGACGEGLAIEHRREPPSCDADGWLIEHDRPDLGCKEIGEGGRVEGAEPQEGMIAGL